MAYGAHVMLDLQGCSKAVLEAEQLEAYTRTLLGDLRLVAVEWCCVVSIPGDATWDDPKTCGVSGCMFLIESAITIHGLWLTGECFVDVFTCGRSDSKVIERITQSVLCPKSMTMRVFSRG